jgi:hypothetical protein
MARQQADLEWYTQTSARQRLPPRCPFALTERCPKYFESAEMLANAELTAPLQEEDRARLDRKWQGWHSPIAEQETSVWKINDSLSSINNLCPEIGYDIFGYFSVLFHRYADEIDVDVAHRRLSREGAPHSDPHWQWASISPQHYTECRMYSILATVIQLDSRAPRKSRKEAIPRGLRWAVLARDGYTCVYCGNKPPAVVLEVDHKVSEADGGLTEIENLVTACEDCNRGKGRKSVG